MYYSNSVPKILRGDKKMTNAGMFFYTASKKHGKRMFYTDFKNGMM